MFGSFNKCDQAEVYPLFLAKKKRKKKYFCLILSFCLQAPKQQNKKDIMLQFTGTSSFYYFMIVRYENIFRSLIYQSNLVYTICIRIFEDLIKIVYVF